MNVYLTDKDRALLDLRKRALDHWTKTCAAQLCLARMDGDTNV